LSILSAFKLIKVINYMSNTPKGLQKVGDSVIVKPNILDPDFGVDIGGWQGRLSQRPDPEEGMLLHISWDSLTLKNMPVWMIERCQEQQLNWSQMCLDLQDVEPTQPRDTEQDVKDAVATIKSRPKTPWGSLGEKGVRIGQVVAQVESDDLMSALVVWEKHLNTTLTFPFRAKIFETWSANPLRMNQKVSVQHILRMNPMEGIIVGLSYWWRSYDHPLCDLIVADTRSPNYDPVEDYMAWFVLRRVQERKREQRATCSR
jgi:hypothetical protein